VNLELAPALALQVPLDADLARPGDAEVFQPTPVDPPRWIPEEDVDDDDRRAA